MRKRDFVIIIALLFIFIFSFSANADSLYDEQWSISGADSIQEALPKEAAQLGENLNIDPKNSGWVNKISADNVFSSVINLIKDGIALPFKTAASTVGIVLLVAGFDTFYKDGVHSETAEFVGTASIAAVIVLPVFKVITSSGKAITYISHLMRIFVPIYCAVLSASGKPITAASSSALLLGMSEITTAIIGGIFSTAVGSYLAISLCSSVSMLLTTTGVAEFIKKAITFGMGLVFTVYLGILGIQTTVNASADSLAVKTGKFLLGSFVPVAGGAVSEALSTVTAATNLVKNSVGIYGVTAVVLILLPIVINLILWRLSLCLCAAASDLFGCIRAGNVIRAADSAVSFLLSLVLMTAVAFIISVAVTTSVT